MHCADAARYRFLALHNLNLCEQMTAEGWIECCQLFKIATTETSPDFRLKIRGIRRTLLPHQMYFAYFAMRRERSLHNGGYLGDEMGLGKTMQALLICFLERWLHLAHNAVNKDRLEGGKHRHLPKGTPDEPQAEDAVCTAGEPFDLCCPCVDRNITAKLLPKQGLTVIQVPMRLISVWWDEFQALVEPNDKLLRMRLFIAHSSANASQKMPTLDKKLLDAMRKDRQSKLPQEGNERFIFLATSGTFDGHVVTPHTWKEELPRPTQGKGSRKVVYVFHRAIHIARLIKDEFHLEKNKDTAAVKQFKRAEYKDASKWMLSGTPFELGPQDLEGYNSALELPGWQGHAELDRCRASSIAVMGQEFLNLSNNRQSTTTPSALAGLFGRALGTLMIRRTNETRWFGKPIVKLPPHTAKDVECEMSETYAPYFDRLIAEAEKTLEQAYQARYSEWVAKGRDGKEPSKSYRQYLTVAFKIRLCTTIPGLAWLSSRYGLSLTQGEMKAKGWLDDDDDQDCPYVKHLQKLVDSSAKLKKVLEIINGMDVDWQGKEEKLVLLSFSPTVARIVYLVSHSPWCRPEPRLPESPNSSGA